MAEVISLGCRLNAAESDRIRAMLDRDGLQTVVINSCAVTEEAVRQTRRAIRRARRTHPDARVLVTGCAADIETDTLSAMPEVDAIVPNTAKLEPASWRVTGNGAPGARPMSHHVSGDATARTRAFVPVQTGCDHSCTFCVIPQGRGPSRSFSVESVAADVELHLAAGAAEIVLTGVDLTSWGHEMGERRSLGQLVSALLRRCPDLRRLRLSSVDGAEIDAELERLIIEDERVMPHLHLSMQSGDDLILKRMKRRHSRMQAVELVQRLKQRRPEISIGADLIAGFPTETEEMHRNNVAILQECEIVHAHIFPFSPRPGTPAARMPQVDPAIVRDRAREMREAAASVRSEWLARMVGTRHRVLVENDGTGHSENFARFRVPQDARPGTIVALTALSIQDGLVIGNYA